MVDNMSCCHIATKLRVWLNLSTRSWSRKIYLSGLTLSICTEISNKSIDHNFWHCLSTIHLFLSISRIPQAINNASVVCCFICPPYQQSRQCRLELQYAQNLGKCIIPCRAERSWKPDRGTWLDFITSSLMRIDFSDASEANLDVKVEQLIARINEVTGNTTSGQKWPKPTS